jgi:hypothetical protein
MQRRLRAPSISIHRKDIINMARIAGRLIRPSTLAERRVLKTLGVDFLRVPRRANPFAVARHIKRLAAGRGGDIDALRGLLLKRAPATPPALPDSTTEPRSDGEQRAA